MWFVTDAIPGRTFRSPDTMKIRYDIPPEEPPSLDLVDVLSGLLGAGPTEIGPLNQFVDLDALDDLLAHRDTRAPWTTSVRLAFDGHVVTIEESTVVVETAEGSGDDRAAPGGPDGRTVAGGQRRVGTTPSNVLLLAPSRSPAETRTCNRLRPGDPDGEAAVLELTVGPSPIGFAEVGVGITDTLAQWQDQYESVGLRFDSLSPLVCRAGLERTFRFMLALTSHVSRLGVDAHYHADPNEHDLETTYALEALTDSTVVAGDVARGRSSR